jgi:N-acetylmuramoyl-L-alanine amidase
MKKIFFTYYGILTAIILALMAFGAFGDEVLTLDERIVALTLLGEARGEGVDGMLAVGMVVQQRSIERKKRPATICLQPRQFSCWNGMGIRAAGRKWFSEDRNATAYARELARQIVKGDKLDRSKVGFANHFHAKWVTKENEDGEKEKVLMELPYWAKDQNATKTIGNHIFYRLK